MSMPKPQFTNVGRELQLKCLNGATMELSKAYIVLGDGKLTTQAPATLTAVIHEVMRIPVTRIRRTGDHVIVGGYTNFETLAAGFYWRELSVEIPDPDRGPIAYCYSNAFDQADYIDPATTTLERLLTVGIVVGDAENLDVKLDESLVFPTLREMQDALEVKLDVAKVGAAGGVAPLDAAGKVPVANLPKEALAPEVTVFVAGTKAPTDTKVLWIDTTPTDGGLKYHNGKAWVHVPVAYAE